jgi:hypothetical protein
VRCSEGNCPAFQPINENHTDQIERQVGESMADTSCTARDSGYEQRVGKTLADELQGYAGRVCKSTVVSAHSCFLNLRHKQQHTNQENRPRRAGVARRCAGRGVRWRPGPRRRASESADPRRETRAQRPGTAATPG